MHARVQVPAPGLGKTWENLSGLGIPSIGKKQKTYGCGQKKAYGCGQ